MTRQFARTDAEGQQGVVEGCEEIQKQRRAEHADERWSTSTAFSALAAKVGRAVRLLRTKSEGARQKC